MDKEQLESAFHREMIHVYEQARSECNYTATRFLQMVNEHGGLKAAKLLLAASGHSEGLTRLWEEDRLDISKESNVVQSPWRQLFTPEELAVVERRLSELEYDWTNR